MPRLSIKSPPSGLRPVTDFFHSLGHEGTKAAYTATDHEYSDKENLEHKSTGSGVCELQLSDANQSEQRKSNTDANMKQLQTCSPPKNKLLKLSGTAGKQSLQTSDKAMDCDKFENGLVNSNSRTLVNKAAAEVQRNLADRPNRNALEVAQGLQTEWLGILAPQLLSEKFQKLADFLSAERARSGPIYPPTDQVFSWSHLCPPSSVRVVILGQDPYHGPRQAHGLAFSVQRPTRAPPSLVNMFKEVLASNAGSQLHQQQQQHQQQSSWPPDHGDLTSWAKQGVLMLNAVLTVRAAQANSHRDKGWESITEAVVRHLNTAGNHLVFMLWGAHAQKQGEGIDRKRHLVLCAPHPSPLSASRGFFGCGHFAKANCYLGQHGFQPVNWMSL